MWTTKLVKAVESIVIDLFPALMRWPCLVDIRHDNTQDCAFKILGLPAQIFGQSRSVDRFSHRKGQTHSGSIRLRDKGYPSYVFWRRSFTLLRPPTFHKDVHIQVRDRSHMSFLPQLAHIDSARAIVVCVLRVCLKFEWVDSVKLSGPSLGVVLPCNAFGNQLGQDVEDFAAP